MQSMRESSSVVGYIQMGTYIKFIPKQKATMLAILHVATKCYFGQLALSSIVIAIVRRVLMLQVMTLMSLHDTY